MPDLARRMITGRQMRAAMGLLGWDVPKLADESGVSESTIRRSLTAVEVPRMRSDNLLKIQRALEAGGCLFLDPGDVRDGGEGVRLRRRP
jgi:hypothetical protein